MRTTRPGEPNMIATTPTTRLARVWRSFWRHRHFWIPFLTAMIVVGLLLAGLIANAHDCANFNDCG